MKLEDIFSLWEVDSKIDVSALTEEAIKIPQLHHKYFKIFSNERLLLRKHEAELKQLKLEKYEFYTQGPTKDTIEKGWDLPPQGKILKNDVNNYIEADKDIINLSLRIGLQKEKIDLLQSIIETVSNRSYIISNVINWEKFRNGA